MSLVDGSPVVKSYEELTLAQYPAEAAKTIQPGASYLYFAVKLMCESSEVSEPLIKQFFHKKPASTEQLVEELGDLLCGISLVWQAPLICLWMSLLRPISPSCVHGTVRATTLRTIRAPRHFRILS